MTMYKVTIQEAGVTLSDWKVVASGTWTPGQRPQLDDQIVSSEVLDQLFDVTPSATDRSGRNQIQRGDMLYAVVFRRLSN